MAKTGKKVYLETYGCQMNLADSEVVLAILTENGYSITDRLQDADLVLINTCSVREHAEQRIYGRLGKFKSHKEKHPDTLVGVLGCMAERLLTKLSNEKPQRVEQIVDLIIGPDEYRKIPDLLNKAWKGEKGIAVQLSRVETYDDIVPLRTDGICAWIPVMRGCDKFCTYCVVPFTRGRERSRPFTSIVKEVEVLLQRGFKEVTLLGQNVNSYKDGNFDFADLLSTIANIDKTLRVRFITSHPQDMQVKLIETIALNKNICDHIHLPIQSGSDRILELMNRNYGSEHYRSLVKKIRDIIPNVAISTDIITGFPTETEEDHKRTLEIMQEIRFDSAFMFKYSPREGTPAYKMVDDVPEEIKTRRISEIINLQNMISTEINQSLVGRCFEVLVEGESKKSKEEYQGRTSTNKMVIFPKGNFKEGNYVNLLINRANSATLFGNIVDEHKQPALKENMFMEVTV